MLHSTHQWPSQRNVPTETHAAANNLRWLESRDDCHGSAVAGASVTGGCTAVGLAAGGGGRTVALFTHDDGFAAARCWVSSDDDDDELQGSDFLPSTSGTSSNGSIPYCNVYKYHCYVIPLPSVLRFTDWAAAVLTRWTKSSIDIAVALTPLSYFLHLKTTGSVQFSPRIDSAHIL